MFILMKSDLLSKNLEFKELIKIFENNLELKKELTLKRDKFKQIVIIENEMT